MDSTEDSDPLCVKGIYVITDEITGEQYVGMSYGIANRWKEHRSLLRGNRHTNAGLQAAWNRDGADAFTIRVLERIGPSTHKYMGEREGYWFDVLDPVFCRSEPAIPRRRVTTFLTDEQMAFIREYGEGSMSFGIRVLVSEAMQKAALERADA